MIPNNSNLLNNFIETQELPSKTYALNTTNNTISGIIDGKDALLQTIYCILNTERFQSLIYSWNYGIEISNLIGEPYNLVVSELQRLIAEALVQDDRITCVDNFEFNIINKNTILTTFTVHTIYGDLEAKKEVNF